MQKGVVNDVRAHRLTIVTPEGITFDLPLAGPLSRCLAWIVDAGCIMVAVQILTSLAAALGVLHADLSRAVTTLLFFGVSIGYAIVLEWCWQGQTLGKRVMGLRVMDLRGLRLHASQIVIRNLLRFVDSLPLFYMLGGIMCLVSRHSQRLGDLAANTIVIQESRVIQPDLDLIMEHNRYNSLRKFPHLVARLRQQVLPDEAGLALQALLRRNEFAPQARIELFGGIAAHLKSKVSFPPEVGEGLSDEQYVRNVVDVIFRK
jgi:uncharacterized RDD family membrane protein YckC